MLSIDEQSENKSRGRRIIDTAELKEKLRLLRSMQL
jgi:hypothetical protein